MIIERGTKIGRFVVVRELGAGGMGAVYAAHDPQLDRQVALKVMRGAAGEEEDRVRMLREGQAMARVTHPNVITVYEVGTDEGIVFLAQELLDGGTLGEWLEEQHTQDAIVEKFIAAGRGLAAAHAAGLVHRDFKPENVLLGKDGRVRVADFGLARAAGHHALTAGATVDALASTNRGGPPRADDVTRSPMSPLTRTGAVMGTPMFMAPEQHKGERADARSDQFGFCVALYHALYKDWPFPGKTEVALADAVIDGRMNPPPKGATVPARLRNILLRGLRTDPEERYPSMDALLADLAPPPARRSRWPLVIGASVLLAGLGVGGYLILEARRNRTPIATQPQRPTGASADLAALTTTQGTAWMTSALDQGRLDDAIEKYDIAAAGNENAGNLYLAASAQAGSAFMRVLRGDLKSAELKLKAAEATVKQASANLAGSAGGATGSARVGSASAAGSAAGPAGGDDAIAAELANAYIDLATAALAGARGQLAVSRERSKRCATELEQSVPLLSSICHQLHGEALADAGEFAAARDAFRQALDIAKPLNSAERDSTLRLAVARIDLDEGKREGAAATASALQTECNDRNALGCEVHARILLARVRLAEAAQEQALELLNSVKPATLETYRARMAHEIALGEVLGYRGEAADDGRQGLDRIEKVRSDVELAGFAPLRFEAKLARVRVLLATGDETAKSEHKDLVKEARSKGFMRIARLAEDYLSELEAQPQPQPQAQPVDGGLPAPQP